MLTWKLPWLADTVVRLFLTLPSTLAVAVELRPTAAIAVLASLHTAQCARERFEITGVQMLGRARDNAEPKLLTAKGFLYDEPNARCICPAGHKLYCSGKAVVVQKGPTVPASASRTT